MTLRWEYIDLARRTIQLPNAKAGPRTVPITQGLADYLASLPRTSPWLFPSSKSRSGYITAIEKTFRKAVIRAGLDPKLINRHTLRHSAITGLIQAGVDLVTVMKVSGHATLAMVQRYAHTDDA